MDIIENLIILFFFLTIFIPAIMIVALSLYRFKGYIQYSMLKWDYRRLPYATTCTICLENTKDGGLGAAYRLPCRHWFHKACLRKWLEQNNNCPNCRHVVNYWKGHQLYPVTRLFFDFTDTYTNDENLTIQRAMNLNQLPPTLWTTLRTSSVERVN